MSRIVRLLNAAINFVAATSPAFRLRVDLQRINALMEKFLEETREIAEERYDQVDAFEVMILGFFLVTETYLPQSKDRGLASHVLNKYHQQMGNSLFTAFCETYGDELRANDSHTAFLDLIEEKLKKRYTEYRKLMLDDKGLWKPFDGAVFDVGRRLIRPSSSLTEGERSVLAAELGFTAITHLERCCETLR